MWCRFSSSPRLPTCFRCAYLPAVCFVPPLFQQVSRTFVISPVGRIVCPTFHSGSYTKPPQLEEAALRSYASKQSGDEFDCPAQGDDSAQRPGTAAQGPLLASRRVKQEADGQSTRAIKNVALPMGVGCLGFVLVCFLGREELRVPLRGFLE